MPTPAPITPLANQVTAVYSSTLFSFQPEAFQSIGLTNHSQWSALPMGVAVNGSAAAVAKSGGQDVLFIVGGRTDAAHASFPGFQKYTFSSQSWQALSPETSVAQNRVQHGAAFLEDSKSILIFGGSQDNSYTATSQTYTISAEEPYDMQSWPAGAPAVQNPILLPYNTSHALLAGGGANQEQIWTFSKADGWVMMTTTVPGGVADASKVKGAISTDGSGNKQLELFDLSQSPYKVSTISLSNQFHKREDSPIVERDDSSAPSQNPRSGFSLAQDPQSGNIIISGGTSDNSDSLAIYNAANKAFEDVSSVFGSSALGNSEVAVPGQGAAPAGAAANPAAAVAASSAAGPQASGAAPTSGAPSQSASAGASQLAGSSAIPSAASGAQSGASAATASGATTNAASAAPTATNSAGAQSSGPATSASGSLAASSGSMAASSGVGQASKTAGGASNTAAAAAAAASSGAPTDGGAGTSSTTIILAAVLGSFFGIAAIFLFALLLVRYRRGKAKEEEQLRQAALVEKRADSPASTIGSIHDTRNKSPFGNGQTPQISRPTLDPQIQAEDLAPPRKLGNEDEWGRYFNNNSTVENLFPSPQPESHAGEAALAGAALGAATGAGFAAAAGARNTAYTIGSEYTLDSPTSSGPRESAIVPPLHLRESSHGQFGRVRSLSDVSSNKRDTHNTNSGSGQDAWGRLGSPDGSEARVRPASSIYYDRASSVYPTNPLSPNTMSNFPPVPMRPNDKGMRSIISTDFGSGSPPDHNGEVFPQSPVRRVAPGSEPRSAGSAHGHDSGEERDLSWLKIGSAN